MGSFGKNIALWIIIGLLLVALFQLFQGGSTRSPSHELAFSEFIADVEKGQVSDVTIRGHTLTGHYIDGREFNTFTPDDPTLVATLRAHQVQIMAAPVTRCDEVAFSLFGVSMAGYNVLFSFLLALYTGLAGRRAVRVRSTP